MDIPSFVRCGAVAFAVWAALTNLAQAQTSAAGTVSAPMRADMTFNGSVLASRDTGTLARCHDACKSTKGCTGFSFHRPAPAAKAVCTLFSGSLTDAAQLGAVSCRMPCEPNLRMQALPQNRPSTIQGAPEAATLPTSARLKASPLAPPPAASDPKK